LKNLEPVRIERSEEKTHIYQNEKLIFLSKIIFQKKVFSFFFKKTFFIFFQNSSFFPIQVFFIN